MHNHTLEFDARDFTLPSHDYCNPLSHSSPQSADSILCDDAGRGRYCTFHLSRSNPCTDLRDHFYQGEKCGERHVGLYFADGDIVLSAAKAAGEHIVFFRVDKVLLCRYSQVLRTLLSIPAHPDANETYDGVVRVHMPDTAEDLDRLLTALYDPL